MSSMLKNLNNIRSLRAMAREFSVDVLFFPLRFAGNHAAGRAGTADFVQLVPVKYDVRPQ